MTELRAKIQVRCIGCQAVGYVKKPVEGSELPKCPLCDCYTTDWVRVPLVRGQNKTEPKAMDPFGKKFEDFDKDFKELKGFGTEYSGLGRPKTLEDRDDFAGLDL